MSSIKKKPTTVENEKTTAEVATPKAAPKAAKKAPAQPKKAKEKTAGPILSSRRVWPD